MVRKIVIIGGGIAGVSAARRLADLGYSVDIYDERDSLLSGSSDDTPCRLGLGFHYPHLETALLYLNSTIQFVKKYKAELSELRVAEENPLSPLRRGQYFLVQDSKFKRSDIFTIWEKLKNQYTCLVAQDFENEVFGPPDKFYEELGVDSYNSHVNGSKVFAAIETAESTLNWPKLKKYLIDQVTKHPKINVYLNTSAISITPPKIDSLKQDVFKVVVKNKQTRIIEEVSADYIVNSSWYNIEQLNKTVGIPVYPEQRTHRIKVIVEIELPPSLLNTHSMFFCFGPYASLTNIGNGRGWLSFEPVTNIASTTDLSLPIKLEKLVTGHATAEEKKQYAEEIIFGASQFITELKGAIYHDVKIGVVRTLGTVDINSSESQHHKRDQLGIQTPMFGFFVNPGMKFLYADINAEVLTKLITSTEYCLEEVDAVIQSKYFNQKNNTQIKIIRDFLKEQVRPDFDNNLNCVINYVEKDKIPGLVEKTLNTIKNKDLVVGFFKSNANVCEQRIINCLNKK